MLAGKRGLYPSFGGVDSKRVWTPLTFLDPRENQWDFAPTQAGSIDSCSFTPGCSWEDWEESGGKGWGVDLSSELQSIFHSRWICQLPLGCLIMFPLRSGQSESYSEQRIYLDNTQCASIQFMKNVFPITLICFFTSFNRELMFMILQMAVYNTRISDS